jgi:hypothetical protein
MRASSVDSGPQVFAYSSPLSGVNLRREMTFSATAALLMRCAPLSSPSSAWAFSVSVPLPIASAWVMEADLRPRFSPRVQNGCIHPASEPLIPSHLSHFWPRGRNPSLDHGLANFSASVDTTGHTSRVQCSVPNRLAHSALVSESNEPWRQGRWAGNSGATRWARRKFRPAG